jgi:O-antigen/teichoic acid export membrane protein
LASLYDPSIGVGYIFIANLISSLMKLILLSDLFYKIGLKHDFVLLKKIFRYSFPMVIIGFAGIINEMLDRSMMKFLLPGTIHENLSQLGIYSACYKISIVMSLFIQAFRFAAEPYFFSIYKNENSRAVYADVMDWFIWFCSGIFIVVTIFLDEFGHFVGKDFRVGLSIVPILLLANLLLGIYVNLSIWYKLTDRTMLGAGVSLLGAGITVVLLWILVPLFGYTGAAWTTLICYASMALISYILGQKYFTIPYKVGNMVIFILLCIGIWLLSGFVLKTNSINVYVWKIALLLLGISALVFMKYSDLKKMVFKK